MNDIFQLSDWLSKASYGSSSSEIRIGCL